MDLAIEKSRKAKDVESTVLSSGVDPFIIVSVQPIYDREYGSSQPMKALK